MRIKFLLASCLLIVQLPDLFSQGAIANLEKYWSYRERLKTEFMIVGDQPGMCMPAERRDTVTKTIFWSDNTIWLGWYTGMLALEYYMLTSNDFPDFDDGDTSALQTTINELNNALVALRRLDEVAESSFPAPCDSTPNVRNGFFIRDDVPIDFHTHFPGMDHVMSEANSASVYNKEMSQDQAYHVLLGLALVKKYIPATLEVNGMNLRQEAIDQALLIAEWMSRDQWIIKNPACQNKDVLRGENAYFLAVGINETVKFISDNSVNHNADLDTLQYIAWSTLMSPANPTYGNVNNLHMAMVLAAMGKGWDDTTLTVMMNLAISNKWYAYPLLYAALHDDSGLPSHPAFSDTMNFWSEMMLDEAPVEGPYTLYPDTNTHGYAVNNRFIRERAKHYIGHDWTANCQFNGLDFMMLHNLYYVVTPTKWPFTTGVHNPIENRVEIVPNPASNYILVKNTFSPDIKIDIEIFNARGQLNFKSTSFNTGLQAIDIATLLPGIYLLSIIDGQGNRLTSNFIKE